MSAFHITKSQLSLPLFPEHRGHDETGSVTAFTQTGTAHQNEFHPILICGFGGLRWRASVDLLLNPGRVLRLPQESSLTGTHHFWAKVVRIGWCFYTRVGTTLWLFPKLRSNPQKVEVGCIEDSHRKGCSSISTWDEGKLQTHAQQWH